MYLRNRLQAAAVTRKKMTTQRPGFVSAKQKRNIFLKKYVYIIRNIDYYIHIYIKQTGKIERTRDNNIRVLYYYYKHVIYYNMYIVHTYRL